MKNFLNINRQEKIKKIENKLIENVDFDKSPMQVILGIKKI